MNEDNTERGWTLHKARPGTRNPTATPTSNQFDSLQDDSESEGSPPEPVQNPQLTVPVNTTQDQVTPPTTNTTIDTNTNRTITEVD